jgi:hypothetical protein
VTDTLAYYYAGLIKTEIFIVQALGASAITLLIAVIVAIL